MDTVVWSIIFLGLGVCGVESLCADPQLQYVPSHTSRLSDVQVSYENDFPITYKCDQSVGYGYVNIRCESNIWSNPDRQCEEDLVVGAGSIAGIMCCVMALLTVVIFIVIATVRQKGKKGSEEATEATENKDRKGAENGNAVRA